MLQPTFRPLGLHCAVISLCVATVSGSSLIKPVISRSWHGLALTPHPIIGLGHYSEPKAMYIGSVVRRLYFSTNNEISGLCVLFQRGARPPHILLLQQIRAHNSPQPCRTAPSTPWGAPPLLPDQVRGQATGNKMSLFPESRALLVNHLILTVNAAAKLCTAPSFAHEQWLA